MHTEHPDVRAIFCGFWSLLIRISSSFHRRPLVCCASFSSPREPLSSSLLFFENATQKHSKSATPEKRLLHLSLRVHVCERIPALSRVFSFALLSHRFFRVAREAAQEPARCTSRDDTCIGSAVLPIGEKESNLQDARTSRQRGGSKTRVWVFVFTAPSDEFGFCDAEHASTGICGRDEVFFFRWFCRGQCGRKRTRTKRRGC